MERRKKRNIWLELSVIGVSMAALFLLLYFVMVVSFQNGTASTSVTMQLAEQIARRVFERPTADQIETTALMIRYGAHLGLFFVVGFVTTFVGMVIFRGYFRILGVFGAGVACYLLASKDMKNSQNRDSVEAAS